MSRKQTPNILIPPDQVQVKVAEWQSRNEPVLLAKRPLTFASLLTDNQSQCG